MCGPPSPESLSSTKFVLFFNRLLIVVSCTNATKKIVMSSPQFILFSIMMREEASNNEALWLNYHDRKGSNDNGES